nr:hypothetical protein [Bacillus cereus]
MKNGATSPISDIVHGMVVLLVLLLFLSPFAFHILNTKAWDTLVLILTFVLTIFADFTTEVRGLFAFLLFVEKMSKSISVRKVLPDPVDSYVKSEIVENENNCPQINIFFTVEIPLFFGTIREFKKSIEASLQSNTKIFLLRMRSFFYGYFGKVSIRTHSKEDSRQTRYTSYFRYPVSTKKTFQQTGLHERTVAGTSFWKSVADNGWGVYASSLAYKLNEQGKQLMK